jgi:hypothetical protein
MAQDSKFVSVTALHISLRRLLLISVNKYILVKQQPDSWSQFMVISRLLKTNNLKETETESPKEMRKQSCSQADRIQK